MFWQGLEGGRRNRSESNHAKSSMSCRCVNSTGKNVDNRLKNKDWPIILKCCKLCYHMLWMCFEYNKTSHPSKRIIRNDTINAHFYTHPVLLVVLSRVVSWIMTGSPSADKCTSASKPSQPLTAMASMKARFVFSGNFPLKPRWAITNGFFNRIFPFLW